MLECWGSPGMGKVMSAVYICKTVKERHSG